MERSKKIAVITGASSGMGREFARRIEENTAVSLTRYG